MKLTSALAPLLLACTLGCSRTSSEALPEWTPADHDHQNSATTGQVDTKKKRPGMPSLEKQGVTDVVLATWKQNCIRCHGVIGRGDGPDGRVLQPPDLTQAAWQKTAVDSELKTLIKEGRGKMPSFAHLPDETVSGLISLIRMLASDKGVQPPTPASKASGSAPSGSAAPPLSSSAAAKKAPAKDVVAKKVEGNDPKAKSGGSAPPAAPPAAQPKNAARP